MNRRWIILLAASCLIGVILGAGVVKWYDSASQAKSRYMFGQRVRCRELADQYAKRESSDMQSVSVEMVGYSVASNSCVAYFHTWNHIAADYEVQEWQVMDVLSGEMHNYEACTVQTGECGHGNDTKFGEKSKAAFQQAITGRKAKLK
jgi:hypothetical protein